MYFAGVFERIETVLATEKKPKTELMTKTEPVTDTAKRHIGGNKDCHQFSHTKLAIETENGASTCTRKPRDGVGDEDGIDDRHRVLVSR